MQTFSFLSGGPSPAVVIEVRNSIRSSVTKVDTGEVLGAEFYASLDTLNKLFQDIQNTLDTLDPNKAVVSVTYDPRLGYPTYIGVDPDKNMFDDGWSYRVSDFQAIE